MGGRTFDQFQSRQKARKQSKPKDQTETTPKYNTETNETNKEH